LSLIERKECLVRIRKSRLLISGVIAVAIGVSAAATAQAATYYNIVNVDSGKALQLDSSGKVRLEAPNSHALGQQFKRIQTEYIAGSQGPWFVSALQNRLGSCLIDKVFGETPQLASGTCTGANKADRMWSHLRGGYTATPSLPGYQLISDHANYMVGGCWFGVCASAAGLMSPDLIALDPLEWSGAAKWEFRYAVTATP
jgi:hypothetical protein